MPDIDPCTVLRQADAAYLALQMGQSVRSVTDQNGQRVEYSQANSVNLLRLIETLQPQCDTYLAVSLKTNATTKPIRFLF